MANVIDVVVLRLMYVDIACHHKQTYTYEHIYTYAYTKKKYIKDIYRDFV